MYTNQSIRLHNKCLLVLENIQEANKRVEYDKKWLLAWDGSGPFDMPNLVYSRSHGEQSLERNTAIAKRLTSYYNRLLIQLSEVAVREADKTLKSLVNA